MPLCVEQVDIYLYPYIFLIIFVHISTALLIVSPVAIAASAQLQYLFAWPRGGLIPLEDCLKLFV